MIDRLRQFIRRQQFCPGPVGMFFNPFYLARAGLRDSMVDFSNYLGGRLLDVGCGTKPYRELFRVDEYVGLDIDSQLTRQRGIADYLYDGMRFPFDDQSFDSVLCNQVLEHVFNSNEFIAEINRVLRPGGNLLLTVPFVWDEHEQPYDYARYTTFGLKTLLEKQGFVIITHRKIGDDLSMIFQLINVYIYKITLRAPKAIRMLLCATVMSLISLMGLFFGKLLPSNQDLYLDNIVLSEKKL